MKSTEFNAFVPTTRWRVKTFLAWSLPTGTLALIPKCPACVAAYAALWTGIGLSIPVAAGLRLALQIGCMAALSFLVFRGLRRAFGHLHTRHQTHDSPPRGCPHCAPSFVEVVEIEAKGTAIE